MLVFYAVFICINIRINIIQINTFPDYLPLFVLYFFHNMTPAQALQRERIKSRAEPSRDTDTWTGFFNVVMIFALFCPAKLQIIFNYPFYIFFLSTLNFKIPKMPFNFRHFIPVRLRALINYFMAYGIDYKYASGI